MSDELALEKAMAEITVPNIITSDITLNTNYKYNTQATWQSSDQNILSNEGVLSKSQNTFKEIISNERIGWNTKKKLLYARFKILML